MAASDEDEAQRIDERRRRADEALARRLADRIAVPAATADPGAASLAQRRMCFLHALDPESAAYHITSEARVEGPVDPLAVEGAVGALVARHEALRTGFTWDEEMGPRRTVAERCSTPFRFVDLAAAPAEEREARAEELVAQHRTTPFDIASPPLLRGLLVRVDDEQHHLALVVHHLVADGWSLDIIHRDLRRLHQAIVAGEDPSAQGPAPGFSEAVAAERARLQGDRSRGQREALAAQLAGAPALDLPMARPRPAVAGFEGRRLETWIPRASQEAVARLAAEELCTPFMVVLAAFTALLHTYSGQDDVVVGTPVANRVEAATQEVVGLFTNTVVLRTRLDPGGSFRALLRSVRTTVLDALDRQDVPFEQVVDATSPERALSHNPLFQVMFALQNHDVEPLGLAGATARPSPADLDICRFDLECTLWPTDDGMRVRINHRTDLFDDVVVDDLAAAFVHLVGAASTAPDVLLRDLDLGPTMRPSEVTGPPPAARAQRIDDALAALAAPRSGVSVADAEGELPLAEVWDRAGALAALLAERGVGRGDVVALSIASSVDLVVAILGAWRRGAAFVPINPADPPARREFLAGDSGAVATVVAPDDPARDGDPDLIACPRRTTGAVAVDTDDREPDDLAYVLYTSGTTGRPKGVRVTHANLAATLAGCQAHFDFGPDASGLVLAAPTFDVFYYELLAPLLGGGRSRLVRREELFDPPTITALAREATAFQAVPGVMEHLLSALAAQGVDELPRMRVVVTGGDLVPPSLLTRLASVFPRAHVAVTYGPTESTIFCTAHDHVRGSVAVGHPIGRPLAGVTIRIADPEGRALPVGTIGEVWVTGGGVAQGYAARAEETAERFVVVDGRRWYRTGDRARLDARTGELEYLGRADSQVKVRGFRIELGEVEAALATAPGVRVGAIGVRGDDSSSRRLDAYVVATDEARTAAREGADRERRVGEWRELFDRTHDTGVGAGPDYTGWNRTGDGTALPAAEMDEWVAGAITSIRRRMDVMARSGRPAASVLEIGCGTGLLIPHLAPLVDRYVGVDLSASVLDRARAEVDRLGLEGVELAVAEAGRLGDILDERPVDVVVLNSVAQYFPDLDHLRAVLADAVARVRVGGFVFVGDLRNRALLERFHAELDDQGDDDEAARQARIAAAVRNEQELVVDPGWFHRKVDLPREVTAVEVEPRRGSHDNELTRHRYDAVLWRRAARPAPSPLTWSTWDDIGGLDGLASAVAAAPTEVVAVTGVPNALLDRSPGAASPAEVRDLATACGAVASLSWAAARPDGSFDVVIAPASVDPAELAWPGPETPGPAATDPLARIVDRRLAQAVEDHLAEILPAYMVPSAVVVLDALPLSANGKVDRERLPAAPAAPAGGRAPQTESELLVARAWTAVLGSGQPAVDDDFFHAGGTSLLAIRLSVALDRAGATISPQAVLRLRSVAALARLIDAGPAGSGQEPTAAPAVLPARPLPPVDIGPDGWTQRRHLLLTGATGMLGVHVLEHALRHHPDLEVTCLVRGANDHDARRRVEEELAWHHPDLARDDEVHERVRVRAADLTAPRLGLGGGVWEELAETAEAAIHCAADVRHVADRDEIFATNVDGTARILDLCAAGDVELHHVSTIGVAGRSALPTDRALTEADLDIGQVPTEAYSESKIEAERAVRAHLATGHRGTILRVGTVGPHSATGRFQRRIDAHFLGRYLRGAVAMGVIADWPDRRIGIVPADVMAQAVFVLTGQEAASGSTFHIRTPHQVGYGDLARLATGAGHPVRPLDPERFRATVLARAGDPTCVEDVGRLLPLTRPPDGHPVRLDATWTDAWLDRLGFRYPEPSEEWFAAFLAHAVEVGYLPSPVPAVVAS